MGDVSAIFHSTFADDSRLFFYIRKGDERQERKTQKWEDILHLQTSSTYRDLSQCYSHFSVLWPLRCTKLTPKAASYLHNFGNSDLFAKIFFFLFIFLVKLL